MAEATPAFPGSGQGGVVRPGGRVDSDPVLFPPQIDYLGERYFFIRECRGQRLLYRGEVKTARFTWLEALMLEARDA